MLVILNQFTKWSLLSYNIYTINKGFNKISRSRFVLLLRRTYKDFCQDFKITFLVLGFYQTSSYYTTVPIGMVCNYI